MGPPGWSEFCVSSMGNIYPECKVMVIFLLLVLNTKN